MKKIPVLTVLLCLLLCSCSRAYESSEDFWTLEQSDAATLADGTVIELWSSFFSSEYRLSDGTALLYCGGINTGPENTHTVGVKSYSGLNAAAQEKISAFYRQQGELFDLQEILEFAYSEYLRCEEENEDFPALFLGQSVAPTASNDKIICFLTTVSLPTGVGTVEEHYKSAYFDCETGEEISFWDLFSVPEDEVRRQFAAASGESDPEKLAERASELDPEQVHLVSDHFEAVYTDLSFLEYSNFVAVPLDAVSVHSWAVPVTETYDE